VAPNNESILPCTYHCKSISFEYMPYQQTGPQPYSHTKVAVALALHNGHAGFTFMKWLRTKDTLAQRAVTWLMPIASQ